VGCVKCAGNTSRLTGDVVHLIVSSRCSVSGVDWLDHGSTRLAATSQGTDELSSVTYGQSSDHVVIDCHGCCCCYAARVQRLLVGRFENAPASASLQPA